MAAVRQEPTVRIRFATWVLITLLGEGRASDKYDAHQANI